MRSRERAAVPSGHRKTSNVGIPRWAAALDGATDGALLAFAGWTLWYEVALAGQWSLWWPTRIWLVLTVVLMVVCVRRQLVGTSSTDPAINKVPAPRPYLTGAVTILLLVAVALRGQLGVVPIVVLGMVLLVAGLGDAGVFPSGGGGPPHEAGDRSRVATVPVNASHAIVALSCLGLAVLASLIVKPNADDAYYLNRATWVAQHGTPAIKDTMFSPGVLPSAYIGGLPLPSIEALQGGLAHVVGISAPSLTYLLLVPILAAVAGWALWRLVRAWAPGAHLLVHAVSLVFLLLSGQSVFGDYFVERIWQGKVIALVILLPLIWLYLGRLARGRDPWSRTMLLACGIAFVGLTATASLLAPVIAAASVLAALVLRSWVLAQGALLFLAAPVVAGVVVALGSADVGGQSQATVSQSAAFALVFGTVTPMVMLGLLAVVLGVRMVPGPVGVLAAASSMTTVAMLIPGVFALADAVTGAGPILWRLLLSSPTAVLVGMMSAWPIAGAVDRSRRDGHRALTTSLTTAAALVVVLLLAGVPVWARSTGATLTGAPAWKVPQGPLRDVRTIPVAGGGPDLWLLPAQQMEVLSGSTTRHFAVVPRYYYLPDLRVPDRALADRETLFALVAEPTTPRVRSVRMALRRLDVTVACVPGQNQRAVRVLAKARGAVLRRYGSMRCDIPDS